MSAYLHQKNAGGFTIAQGPIQSHPSGGDLGGDVLASSQSVPHIMSEIENFVIQFKNAESALIQERTKSLQIWQELRDLRGKFERAKLEYEEKLAEKMLLQDRLQSDLGESQEREKKLALEVKELEKTLKSLEDEKKQILEESKKAHWSAVNQERERTHQYYHELKKLYSQYHSAREKWIQTHKSWTVQLTQTQEKHTLEKKKILDAFTQDKALALDERQRLMTEIVKMKGQISEEQRKIQALSAEIQALRKAKQSSHTESEQWRKKLELFKTKLLPYYHGYRKAHEEIRRLRGELETLRTREQSQARIQGDGVCDSSTPVGQRSASLSGRTPDVSLSSREPEVMEAGMHRQSLENLLDQERKAKERVLEELREAQEQKNQVNQELQNLKEQWLQSQGIAIEGLELKF